MHRLERRGSVQSHTMLNWPGRCEISINSRVEATHKNVVNDEETLPESPIDMPEICDSNIFGNWKAVWWQNGLEGERTTFALGDMRWRFSRDNIYTPYSEGFSSKSKFSCRGSKIFIYNIESGKEISNIRVHSLSYGELIVNEIGRYVHWKRI